MVLLLKKEAPLLCRVCHPVFFLTSQSERGSGTRRGVAADLPDEVTSIAAGAKTEVAAAGRNAAVAGTGRAGIAAAPPETTRSTGGKLHGFLGRMSPCTPCLVVDPQTINKVKEMFIFITE